MFFRQVGLVARARIVLLLTFVCLATTARAQGHAHEHGVVKLDIAIEAGKVTVQMESPLDNLLGFERAPRNDAERKRAEATVTQLKAADALFKIDPAAGCSLANVELTSAPLKLGKAEPAAAESEHADLDGDFEFNCKDAAKATYIDLGLFSAFSNMHRIDVQVAALKGQLKRTLRRPATRIVLAR